MTEQEEKEIIRVCGPNYKKSDIPTFIRRRDESEVLESMGETHRQEEKEKKGKEKLGII